MASTEDTIAVRISKELADRIISGAIEPGSRLRQDALALVDIAFLLGFQEQSAFTHAFREWSGMNPGAWRERALAGTI